MSKLQANVKRIFDLLFSVVGLIVFFPVIFVCIVVASISTGATGLFIQSRVGQYGKLIRVKKIRTMRQGNSDDTTVTVAGDARITPAGHWMRRYKLDELPQLWNVLVGDMSFVGPRPDVPGYADTLVGEDRTVLNLKPGITGPATIKYRDEELILDSVENAEHYNDSVIYPDKVRMNLEYAKNWSLLADVRYILMTVRLLKLPDALRLPS